MVAGHRGAAGCGTGIDAKCVRCRTGVTLREVPDQYAGAPFDSGYIMNGSRVLG